MVTKFLAFVFQNKLQWIVKSITSVTGIPYEVRTFTSDSRSAGTSANVFIQLYGREVCTLEKPLCVSKLDREDKFKRGAEDMFVVEVGKARDKNVWKMCVIFKMCQTSYMHIQVISFCQFYVLEQASDQHHSEAESDSISVWPHTSC